METYSNDQHPAEEQLVSDEVQEIISYKPHWIVRKGNAIFFVVVILLFALTWLIRYPDIVNSNSRLVALNPPKLVSSKVEGKLLKLLVKNEQEVSRNQHLGYMESTADYNEVIKLQKWIDATITSTQSDNYEVLTSNPLPQFSELGELQTNYQEFQNELLQMKQTLASGYYQKKKNALAQDLQYIAKLKVNAGEKQKLLEQDKQLQNNEYSAYESLAKEKVIAPLELNQYKSKVIASEQTIKQIDAEMTNSDINSHNKEKELLDLQKSVMDQQQKFHSSLLDLKSQIDKWVQQYVLVAPEEGKVLFVSTLQENELVGTGQGLFFVQPAQTEFYAELMASQAGLGKVKPGQKVIIKVASYPNNEFGYLSGIVSYISNIPSRHDSFMIKVNLPKGLETSYKKTLFFRNDLSGKGEIITDDRKLFDRMAGQLMQIWER